MGQRIEANLYRALFPFDEIVYAARISPFSKVNKIPESNVEILVRAIRTILTEAESHIRQYFPDTVTEKERDFLQVHRPKQTLSINGEVILKTALDKRKTYYVESQRLIE